MHPRIICYFLALSLPLIASANLANGRYFQAISTAGSIKNDLWYQSASRQTPIYVSQTVRSTDYSYDEGSSITFYGDRINDKGEPVAEAIAQIPSDASRLLLIFSPLVETNEQGFNYNVYALRDDTNQFAFGSFQFINASSQTVAIDLQGNQFILKRGSSNNLAVEPPERGDLSIKVAVENKFGQWRSNYTNGWSHRSNLRTIAFIVDGRNDRVKILRYRQTEPKE